RQDQLGGEPQRGGEREHDAERHHGAALEIERQRQAGEREDQRQRAARREALAAADPHDDAGQQRIEVEDQDRQRDRHQRHGLVVRPGVERDQAAERQRGAPLARRQRDGGAAQLEGEQQDQRGRRGAQGRHGQDVGAVAERQPGERRAGGEAGGDQQRQRDAE